MFSFAPAIAGHQDYQDALLHLDYYSVEFGLNGSHPVYQFKLRHSERTPHFFLIKDTSALASQLKEGDIVPMKYYCDDTARTMEQHNTRIESIVNETQGRYKGHYRINLSILYNKLANVLQPTGTDC
ncbi:MAG: hypothetical protein PVH87_20175 [Desulfobacteraceae bacterium]|jgi:hypothetical protein